MRKALSGSDLQRWLAVVNVLSLGTFVILSILGASGSPRHFDEIEVERLNVVGANGRPVMVLANRARIPGPMLGGREYPREFAEGRSLLSGMLFYNEQGDEVGGLLFNGFRKGSGKGDYGAIEHFSLDQWRQNQVIMLQYNDHGDSRRAGLTIFDRPTNFDMSTQFDRAEEMRRATGPRLDELRKEAAADAAEGSQGAQRIFVGSRDRVAQVELDDSHGLVRARLYVGADDTPRLDFLDPSGVVVATYPPRSRD